MSDWSKCTVSRAALTIYLHQDKECPHPYDCRFWDGLRERCSIRLATDTLAVEVVLNKLNRLGWSDSSIAKYMGVTPSVVSRWRGGKAPVPEERMAQLESLLTSLRNQAGIGCDTAYTKMEMGIYIRRLLNFLNNRGYNDSRIAWYLGLAKSSVSHWRIGRNMPRKDRLEDLEKLADELSAGDKDRNRSEQAY